MNCLGALKLLKEKHKELQGRIKVLMNYQEMRGWPELEAKAKRFEEENLKLREKLSKVPAKIIMEIEQNTMHPK